jgi:ribonuclease BN (tRNA processing enzyme)
MKAGKGNRTNFFAMSVDTTNRHLKPDTRNLTVTILGSGTGVPLPHRHAPGLVVEAGSTKLLLDSGSGAAYQLAQAGFNYHEFDHLFYTHCAHPDHINDLPELIFANKYFDPRRTRELYVYGPTGLRDFVEKLADLYPALAILEYPIKIYELKESSVAAGEATVISKPLDHQGNDCVGYRAEYGGKSIVYSGDTDYCENLTALAHDADVLVVECSFPNEYKVQGHLVPDDIAAIAGQARARKVVLTHLYPPCDTADVVSQVKRGFGGDVVKAEDLMKIEIL